MNDNSLMPYGQYKGDKMLNVPASYLIWLYENDKAFGDVLAYIKENLDVLKMQVKQRK